MCIFLQLPVIPTFCRPRRPSEMRKDKQPAPAGTVQRTQAAGQSILNICTAEQGQGRAGQQARPVKAVEW